MKQMQQHLQQPQQQHDCIVSSSSRENSCHVLLHHRRHCRRWIRSSCCCCCFAMVLLWLFVTTTTATTTSSSLSLLLQRLLLHPSDVNRRQQQQQPPDHHHNNNNNQKQYQEKRHLRRFLLAEQQEQPTINSSSSTSSTTSSSSSTFSICSRLELLQFNSQKTSTTTTSTTTATSIWRNHLEQILEASIHPYDKTSRIHESWTRQLLQLISQQPHIVQRAIRVSPPTMNNGQGEGSSSSSSSSWDAVMKKLAYKMQHVHDPSVPPLRIVVFGGSVTEGRDCNQIPYELDPLTREHADSKTSRRILGRDCSWPFRLQQLINMALGDDNDHIVKIHNLAVGGTNTYLSFPIIQHWLYPEDSELSNDDAMIDIIVNAYSTNDNLPPYHGPKNTTMHRSHSDTAMYKFQGFVQACYQAHLAKQPQQEEEDHDNDDDANKNERNETDSTAASCIMENLANNENDVVDPATTTTTSNTPPPVIIYMDDYVGNQGDVLLGEMQVHDRTQELARFHSSPIPPSSSSSDDYLFPGMAAIGHVSSMDALWRSLILPNTTETLLSPKWKQTNVEVHFGMPGHVARSWIFAFALLQWTVDYCQDDVNNYSNNNNHNNNSNEHQQPSDQQQPAGPASDTTSSDDLSLKLFYYDRTRRRIVRNTISPPPSPPEQQQQQQPLPNHDAATSETTLTTTSTTTTPVELFATTTNNMYHYEPLSYSNFLLFSNISQVWKHGRRRQQRQDNKDESTNIVSSLPKCNDDAASNNNTHNQVVSSHHRRGNSRRRQRPCSFAFVAAPMGTHASAYDLNKYMARHSITRTNERNIPKWQAQDDIKNGWQNKLGLVATAHGARLIISLPNITTSIQVITLHYLKSYGDKWDNSTANFTLSIVRQDHGRVATQDAPDGTNQTYSMDQTYFQLQGFHDQKTSVSYPYTLDIGKKHRARPGDSVDLEMELIHGQTFKIVSLLMCNH